MTEKKITHMVFGDTNYQDPFMVFEDGNLDTVVNEVANEFGYGHDEYDKIRIVQVHGVVKPRVGRISYESV